MTGRSGPFFARPALRDVLILSILSIPVCFVAGADIIILKNGSRIEGRIERTEPGPACVTCRGTGDAECPHCQGSGRVVRSFGGPDLPGRDKGAKCLRCDGKGRVKCAACKGRGRGEKTYVVLLRGGVRMTVRDSRVKSIERSYIAPEELLPPRESYAARLRKLGKEDAAGELALARWALERGLLPEASKHARRAAAADPLLVGDARAVYEPADRRRDAAASKAVASALEHVRAGRLEQGLRVLRAARDTHAKSPLLADPERERAFIAETAPGVARRYGRSLGEIAVSVERKIRLACGACGGAGSLSCRKCNGTGEGACARCRGAGKTWCPECNGTDWRVCARCGGTRKTGGAHFGISSTCTECRGRGVIACTRCGNGRIACPACKGKGRIAGACKSCSGAGGLACKPCLGTGLRRPAALEWGPVEELRSASGPASAGRLPVRSTRTGIPVWQGIRRGCIVTVVRAGDLHEGALSAHLGAVLGSAREFVAVCVDNRDGGRQVRFRPGEQGLRLVTAKARQVEAEAPPDIKAPAKDVPDLRAMLAQLRPAAVLPGVLANVVAAFPEGTDLAGAESLYWGRDDPLRLERRRLTADELAAIRKTLH